MTSIQNTHSHHRVQHIQSLQGPNCIQGAPAKDTSSHRHASNPCGFWARFFHVFNGTMAHR